MSTQPATQGRPSPEEAQRFQADMEDMEWFDEHREEIFVSCRGKYVTVVNKELFVGDTPEEVWAKARAKYPDRGPGIHYIHPNPPKVMFYDCARDVRSHP
ncbi:MAG: DUF5678 domain-containing protein [Abditibacteriales bacterium]|nr:DUF5678 domain-containing protein [Abditibacteriales bacterium]MDW8368361.1 DUF5678 domain-containing protein [Abditibacteriales bacterium]